MARCSFKLTGLILTLVFGVFIAAARGQRGESTNDSPPRFTAGVDLVSLDLCGRDASGRLVPDLSAEDFLILENGKPQQASFLVPSSAVPLTAVLLLDVSHRMYGDKLKKKLDVDFRGYVILGACNPSLAHQALSAEPQIGLLLPCNVVVQEAPQGGILVTIADLRAMFSLVDKSGLGPIVDEAERRLHRVIESLA